MWFDRIFLLLGWAGVGMIILDLHLYSPLPGKKMTHLGVIISAACFVILGMRLLFFKKKR